jgi:hypothetical protein
MSQGSVFSLVTRDERFDQRFQAADALRIRLDKIRRARAAEKARLRAEGDPRADAYNVQPTFTDLARTHLNFVHGTYRPFVSVASEYAKVKASGDGTVALTAAGGTLEFAWPIFGHFTSDMVLHIRVHAIGSADAAASEATPTAQVPLLRYCAYPGLRIAQKVELKSGQVLIDDYTPDDAVKYGKFFVGADQRAGWDRCLGQQEQRLASYSANGFTGTLTYSDGPQTPKLYHDTFDIFAPLQFWFCQDPSRALLNDMIPNTQRVVTVHLASIDKIVQAMLPAPPGDPDPLVPQGFVSTPLPFSRLKIEANLYVNNLTVNPEIHDIFASRIGMTLARVHRRQTNPLQAPSGAFLLDQLKFPAEYLMVGMRDRALANDFDRWWLMGMRTPKTRSTKLVVPAIVWNAGLLVNQLVVREAVEQSTLDSFTTGIGVTAHGITMHPMAPALFYNAYKPIRYVENSMIVSPIDTSEFLVTFCLYPGAHNPSGYYNLSAGREMYIQYSTRDAADVAGRCEMVITMSSLNFLIRRGDAVSLAFSA